MILTTNAYSQNPYSAPEFSDQHRLDKIQKVFPKIQKIYQDYAKKNHFPGFAFGIMVDGTLVYSGAEGYSDIEEKTLAANHLSGGLSPPRPSSYNSLDEIEISYAKAL